MAYRKTNAERRINQLIRDIPKNDRDQALEIAQNIMAMEEKLRESREKIWGMDIVITYNNGGGQTGLRENPAYKAYAGLLSAYQKALKQLDEMRKEAESSDSLFDWNK